MKIRRGAFLPALVTTVSVSCTGVSEDEHAMERRAMTQALEQREQVAASGRYLVPPSEIGAASAATMAAALDIPADAIVTTQLITPHVEAAMDVPELGVIKPRQGSSFVVMSTGRNVVTVAPEPGTDFAPGGIDGDAVTLRIQLRVPAGANRMSFDYNFLSAESPDFVGSSFNDTFVARVTDALGARVVATASVNSARFHEASESRAGGTGYVLYVDDPAGVDEVFGTAAYPPDIELHTDAGLTDFQTVNVAVASGGTMTLEFDIRDLGDGIFDSAVVIDNVTFSAVEVVDPSPDLLDEFDGSVRSGVVDLPALVAGGRPVTAVAADGTTQLLLRSNVPGPGRVTFELDPANAGDGGLAALGSDDWQDRVEVDAVQATPGKYYGLAVYRSPADFNRGANQADATRDLRFSATYAAAAGGGFTHQHTIDVVRPPVVIVHNIWSSCTAWKNAKFYADEADEYPFAVTCADYSKDALGALGNSARSLHDNRKVVQTYVAQAISNLRDLGVAVSQADVIGHGLGGLLARRYMDTSSYRRFTNRYEGDIHRFITMNTPHLGTRMADEIVVYRELVQANPTAWGPMNATLKGAGIYIDDSEGYAAIDDLTTGSNVIEALAESPVPSHVMVSTGGLAYTYTEAKPILLAGVNALYTQMAFKHPKSPAADKYNLIFKGRPPGGAPSKIFCADEHDLFATAAEQAGGIAVHPDSLYTVSLANADSEHFKVLGNPAHSDRLAALLNAPLDGGLFAPSLPAPSTVPATNSCVAGLAAASDEPPLHTLADGDLAIVSPTAGTVVTAGSTVSVTVEASGGFSPEVVIVVGGGNAVVLDAAPFVAQFPVPADAIGTMSLMAVGFDEDAGIGFAQEVGLNLHIPATLQALEVLNGDAVLPGPGATRQLTVLGSYSDGVQRDVSPGRLGSRYSSSDPSIASVSEDGLITTYAPGIVTIVVRNGLAITSVSVKVEDGGASPEAQCRNVTVAADASCQAQASIDDGSFDPDELPQPLALTQSPAGPYGLGTHAVTLTASDGADSDTCQATVSVVDQALPALAGCDDITVAATPGLGGAYVTYEVTGSDNCSDSVPAGCDVAPGSFFAMGESRPVTCAAADSAGNLATCTFAVTVDEPTTCDATQPQSQDYWRTQCNYRAPDGTPPDPTLTVDILQQLIDGVEADVQATCGPAEPTCAALNPDPYWDACEQACQHYAALLLNIASARAPSSCCTPQGTSADTVAHVAELIVAGECHQAISIAADFNIGCLFCDVEH